MAEEQELDLVEISPNASPPVCKIIDYQKFLYQQKRKQKELKAKTAKIIIKEIRFGPYTDDHDYEFKLKHAQRFLQDGAKVKAYVFFKGRSIVYNEEGESILQRFSKDLEELAKKFRWQRIAFETASSTPRVAETERIACFMPCSLGRDAANRPAIYRGLRSRMRLKSSCRAGKRPPMLPRNWSANGKNICKLSHSMNRSM